MRRGDDGCGVEWHWVIKKSQHNLLSTVVVVTMDCCWTNFNLEISARNCLIRLTKSSVGMLSSWRLVVGGDDT